MGVTVAGVNQWHASPCRTASATRDSETGEIRVPLALFHVDQPQGTVKLVLSRVQAEHLHATLSRMLTDRPTFPAQ
ncbi:hypothetical protein [Streptomyces alkaliterrae]|uniref:Uncharacterized protein n=1 Tax=Streptomyces alkaliterrae TaxID=2213162 RepID=A0A5P0YMA1_9ACTN|nr:hypothetical protein [Streptomyces alkaliterrae]MBB1252660.1 hypothetical protein [Streptomyces alkaliterrae]MBB1257999.1 hypothetical protein [Streptomyces alkaliterrae]MQS01401.1 hypothetical protein [Streptomyces alkaliterrae]